MFVAKDLRYGGRVCNSCAMDQGSASFIARLNVRICQADVPLKGPTLRNHRMMRTIAAIMIRKPNVMTQPRIRVLRCFFCALASQVSLESES